MQDMEKGFRSGRTFAAICWMPDQSVPPVALAGGTLNQRNCMDYNVLRMLDLARSGPASAVRSV